MQSNTNPQPRGSRAEQQLASLRDPHAPRYLHPLTRFLLGATATGPLIFLIAMVATGPATPQGMMLGLIALLWAAMLLFGFTAMVFNNPRLSGTQRWTWSLAFLVAAPIALPMYWARHVLPAPKSELQHG